MCFKDSFGNRIVRKHWYRVLYSYRHHFFCKKKFDRILIIEIENISGHIYFSLLNKQTEEVKELNDPVTGVYEFELPKGNSFVLKMHASRANGKYVIKIKNV